MRLIFNKLIGSLGCFSKPNFIIVGAQKAGTSALYDILEQHSKITPSIYKELHYFDNDKLYSKNNLKDYHCKFPLSYQTPQGNLVFEASPLYIYHPKVAKRLYDYNPNIKLIVMLRNPVERAISAWTMYHHHFINGPYKHLYDNRPFKEAIQTEINNIDKTSYYNDQLSYVKRGIYHLQIEEYLKYFPKENLLFIESEELKKDFKSTLNHLFQFLNIPSENIATMESNKSRIHSLDLGIEKEILTSFYKPYNEKLFELIGKRYNW